MFVLSTDDGSAIRSASKVTVYHAFGDGDIRWRGKIYSVSGKQELSVSDTPVVPVKPSAPVGSGASGTKEPAVLPFTDVAKQDWFYGDVAYVYEKGMMGYVYIPDINENAYFDKDGIVVETSSNIIADVPQIDGISCDEVVLYEKLPIKSSDLKNILSLTQALKRKDLVPDKITYGVDNAPVLTYGSISVLIGDTDLLTKKVERLATIMPDLSGMGGTLHLEDWNEENTNIVFQKNE